MLPEDAEARFRRIEDNLVVTAELQRRAEARSKEDIDHLKAIQNAMARWMDKMADRQDEFESKLNAVIDIQMRGEQEMRAAIADLSRTVDRYLKSRTNGGDN
jgi:hypothetical protein